MDLYAADMTAAELYKNCKNYHDWVVNKFDVPVNEQLLFNMGKCLGQVETTGKMMLTLCRESRRNANISNQLTANLKRVKTFSIVEELVNISGNIANLQKYDGQLLLMQIIRQKWPCL